MTFTSLGDLAQSQMLRRNMASVKAQMQQHTEESMTGSAADLSRGLGTSLGAFHAIRNSLSRLDGFAAATTEMGLMATTMQTAVQSIAGFASDLAPTLLSAGTYAQGSTLKSVAAEAEEKFLATVSLLNSRVGDRAVFGGTATDRAPLPDGAALLATLRGEVAGETTAAGVRDAISAWFADPAGYAALYAGSDTPLNAAIAEGESATLDLTADHSALRETLVGFALAAMAGGEVPTLTIAEQAALATMAGSTLLDSGEARADLTADLAMTEGRVAQAQSRNSAEAAALELTQAELAEVDAYEAATRLTEAQTRLEAIYAITARLSELSLANYLR